VAKVLAKKIKIETGSGKVSAILDLPNKVIAGVTLAHGAGAGMNHAFMEELASSLTSLGFAVLRFQFPYMEAGKKRTDRPPIATATVVAAVSTLRERVPDVPIFAAGKSFGARMTTTAASEGLLDKIAGVICYGFPLHTPGEPDIKRAVHLARVPLPILFLQGTRDELADLKLMGKVCAKLPRAHLHVVEGADHAFAVLKRSGRSSKDIFEELARESLRFSQNLF
jgi:predicted alpha/beta-hydrolase family hydrolase